MNKPVKRFTSGNIRVAIWLNKGKERDYYTITISRSFKNASDEWQNTDSLRVSDIPKTIMLLMKAYEELAINEESVS